MVLKFVGGLLIFASCTAAGFTLGKGYSIRVELLRSVQFALNILANEIKFSLNSLPDALHKVSQTASPMVSGLFYDCAQLLELRTGLTASEAWSSALSKSNLQLADTDMEILKAFGNVLGCSDTDGQIKNINLTCAQLLNQEQEAQKLQVKNEKLFKSIGVLCGMLIAILFI